MSSLLKWNSQSPVGRQREASDPADRFPVTLCDRLGAAWHFSSISAFSIAVEAIMAAKALLDNS
jgi:hypothetical protein